MTIHWLGILAILLQFALPVLPVSYFWWRNRQWVPQSSGRRPGIRNFEAVLMFTVIVLMAWLWLYDGIPRLGVPSRFSSSHSETLRSWYSSAAVAGSCAAVVGIVIAWRFSTTVAAMFVLIAGVVGTFGLEAKVREQTDREWQAKHPPGGGQIRSEDAPPVTLRFELIANLAGADLWINDVYLGKTPYETTDRELFSKVPLWTLEDVGRLRYPQTPENTLVCPQGNSMSRWGWIPLHLPVRHEDSTKLYCKVDLNGVPGFSWMSAQETQGPQGSADSVIVVKLDTVFSDWETAIEELLDRARLADYDVDEAWIAAFDSYGTFATKQLDRAMLMEPRFREVRDARVRVSEKLQGITDPAAAWERLMKIQEEARTSHRYDSGSSSGIALDLLVPLLDPEQLVDHAIDRLKNTKNLEPGNRSYGNGHFATYHEDGSVYGDETALWPIAQAIWRLDQQLDAASAENAAVTPVSEKEINQKGLHVAIRPETDNIVEQRITPLLLQLSYGYEHRLDYAAILGGSAYDSFLLRNDWRKHDPDDWGHSRTVGDHENRVNIWFYRLLSLRSPLGTAFRNQQADTILKICHNGVSQHTLFGGSLSTDLDFLFLDREFDKDHPSLAMRFWPDLNAIAKGQPGHQRNEMLRLRWNYLARLWPESAPEMFLPPFREATDPEEYMFVPDFPSTLSADAQFEILQTVLSAEIERVEKLPADPEDKKYNGPKYHGGRFAIRRYQITSCGVT